jgi:hypothetical protein
MDAELFPPVGIGAATVDGRAGARIGPAGSGPRESGPTGRLDVGLRVGGP